MSPIDSLKVALRSIRRRPMRSALAALGVTISVASVVAILSISDGVSRYVQRDLESLISNGMLVTPAPVAVSGPRAMLSGRLTDEDVAAVRRDVPGLTHVASIQSTRALLIRGNKSANVHVTGVESSYFKILHLDFDAGGLWSDEDDATGGRVCILAKGIASTLLGKEDPLGQSVRLGNFSYRVVGVLVARGTSLVFPDQEDRVMMPLSTFRKRVSGTNGQVDSVLAATRNLRVAETAASRLDGLLRALHQIADGEAPDYKIRTQKEFREKQKSITGTLTRLLLAVASVSLIVGGFGVMNIMLVTVAERTREIGIRAALGATPRDILVQFIVEPVVICSAGGAVGLALGEALTAGAGRLVKMDMSPTPTAIALALGISVLCGVVFGFLPAHRAARLPPVEALRTE